MEQIERALRERRDQAVLGLGVFWDAFPDARNDVIRVLADGPLVAAEGIFAGTHTGTFRTPQGAVAPTDRGVRLRWSAMCEVQDEELVFEHLYFDQLELLGQLGLAPAGAPAPV